MFSFFRKKFNPKSKLKAVFKDYALPSFPTVVMQALAEMRKSDSSASSIAAILSLDPGLSVQVLRIANSPIFSPVKKVENLSQAVAIVGLSQLESLVLSVGIGNNIGKGCSAEFDSRSFWRASARRGVLARNLAKTLIPAKTSECFTAGFLQDMAVPFLVGQRPAEYGPILEDWKSNGGSLADLEGAIFDWNHAEVATWMCAEWDFPESIAASIGGHHGVKVSGHEPLLPVVLVSQLREGDECLGVDELIESAVARTNLTEPELVTIIESSFENAEELARLLG